MGKVYDGIDAALDEFIKAQPMFFVGTAPLAADGHVNLSPKGLDTMRVIDSRTIAYLDHVGSGVETIAHLRENGRIVVMFCAFQAAPRIVRVHGRGEALEPGSRGFDELRALFPPGPPGRAVIRVAVERVADSCGFGVPLFSFDGSRSQLPAWVARTGETGLLAYQRDNNRFSIDGLPALRWPDAQR